MAEQQQIQQAATQLDKSISLFNDVQQERVEKQRVMEESSDDDSQRKFNKDSVHYSEYTAAKQFVNEERRKFDDALEGMDQKIL